MTEERLPTPPLPHIQGVISAIMGWAALAIDVIVLVPLTRSPTKLPIIQGFRLVIALLIVGLWSVSVSAATIKTARDAQTHKVLFGVTVEGEIERGDTVKLLHELMTEGPELARYVFLRSKGGDVEEAMKMGTLIRRLRLVAVAPMQFYDEPIWSKVLLADKDNNICASACS